LRSLILSALLAGAATAAPAASLTSLYSSFFAFGDSLSDTGNVFASTPNAAIPLKVPGGPYVGGRFSNGPVWTDSLIGEFAAAGRPAAGLAFGLANAASDGPSADLAEQIGLFDRGGFGAVAGPRPLASLWFGANDVFGATDSGSSAPDVAARGAAAAQAVAGGVGALALRGFSDFLVLTLPDLGRVPAYAAADPDRVDEATAGSSAFNAALPVALGALPGSLRVTVLDIEGLFAALLAAPGDFGVVNATDACFAADALSVSTGLVPGCADASARAFFDEVHPTTTIHARIAAEARAALGAHVAPVPVGPAGPMLAAALGLLAAAGAMRRGAAAQAR
jgi:outer membrane lipase/esterase